MCEDNKQQQNHHHDVVVKPQIVVPIFNELYDTLRSTRAWRYVSDNYASGTITTVAGATVAATVNLSTTSDPYRLSRWPDGVQVYLVLRFFGIAPQAVPVTVGNIECLLIDKVGATMPLGEFMSNAGGNMHHTALLKGPITDPGETLVGTLSVALSTGSSAGTFNYSMGFSYAYLLPAEKGYKLYEYTQNPLHTRR